MELLKDLGTAVEKQLAAFSVDLQAIEAGNRSGVDLYLQVHDTTSAVAGMTTCLYTLPVPAGTRTRADFDLGGLHCTTGLRVLWSTTEHTATAYTGSASALGVWAHRRVS